MAAALSRIPMLNKRHPERSWRHLVSMPIIYLPLPFIMVMDVVLEIYHRICFPLYGISYVPRSRYIRVWDRFRLPYITIWDKIGCAYCGYANGWINYARKVASETEAYWCGIRHRTDAEYIATEHEDGFVPYGDEVGYRERYLPPRR